MHPQQFDETRPQARSRWGLVILSVLAIGLYLLTSRPAPAWEGWKTDYDQAMAQAASEQTHVLVAFYMDGCAYCEAMDKTVLNRSEVRAALEPYIPVRVNLGQHIELASRYGVAGAPTFAVLAASGKLLDMSVGYQPPADFIGFLQRAASPRRGGDERAPGVPTGNP